MAISKVQAQYLQRLQTVKVKLTAFVAPSTLGKNSKVNTVVTPADITELMAEDVRITLEESQLY